MANVSSNIVTPQQAAINAKKGSPLLPGLGGGGSYGATPNYSAINLKAPQTSVQPVAKGPVAPPAVQVAPTAPMNPAVAANGTGNNTATPDDHTSKFTGLLQNIVKYATQGNQALSDKAGQIGDKYAKEQADLGIFDRAAAGDQTTGTMPVGGGNANIEFQSKTGRSAALTSAENAELAPINQQLTAQNQGQSGLISGLNAAQPQLGTQGQTYYDPTGNLTDDGKNASLNPIANIPSIAQQVANGQISPAQADALGGNVSNFAGALNQAILALNPKYDRAQSQAAFDSKQQNATTAGTAPTNAYAATFGANYPQYVALKQNVDNVAQLGNLALTVGGQGGINPLSPQFANLAINQFKNQLSSADQVKFNSAIVAFAGAASQLLTNSSGQTPTGVTDSINGIISGNVPMATLQQLVQQAVSEGNVKLSNAAAAVNTPGAGIGAPTVGTSNSNPVGI